MVIARGPLTRATMYLARAEWALALGDTAAAINELAWHDSNDLQGWPVAAPQDGELDAALSAPVRWRLALLQCTSGARDLGRQWLRRAGRLWSNADHDLARTSGRANAEAACR
jgi:hypothetical protein